MRAGGWREISLQLPPPHTHTHRVYKEIENFPARARGKCPCKGWRKISLQLPPTPCARKFPTRVRGKFPSNPTCMQGNFPECGFLDGDDCGMRLVFYLKIWFILFRVGANSTQNLRSNRFVLGLALSRLISIACEVGVSPANENLLVTPTPWSWDSKPGPKLVLFFCELQFWTLPTGFDPGLGVKDDAETGPVYLWRRHRLRVGVHGLNNEVLHSTQIVPKAHTNL